MIEDFIKSHIKEVDYSEKIKGYNLQEPEAEYIDLINSYKSPNRAYIKASARGLSSKEISFYTLSYIIETCHQCSLKERYEAIIVILQKFYDENQVNSIVDEFKEKLIDTLNSEPENTTSSFEWVDKYSDGNNQIFYFLDITIGSNRIYKYGITSDKLRQRLASIKSNIKDNYNRQTLAIKPMLIIECADNKLFEDEIKILISEYNLKSSNYNFRGYTETLTSGSKDVILNDIIKPTILKFESKVLYDYRII